MANHHSNEKLPNHLEMSEADYKHHKKDVYKTTVILSIVTIVEVVFAIFYEKYLIPMGWSIGILRLFLVLASLVKAIYIMAVFMHVKHEYKSMILTILLPFTLLIWMIISFIWDGDSWNNLIHKRFGEKPHPSVIKEKSGVKNENHVH